MDEKIKSPKEFEYLLWIDKETRKYYARIKCTGEACELTHEHMKFLRNEEKKIMRKIEKETEEKKRGENFTILSLDVMLSDKAQKSDWDEDKTDYAELVETKIMEEEFRKLLTAKQLDIYEKCILSGLSNSKYAELSNITEMAVRKQIKYIQKKAIVFFAN